MASSGQPLWKADRMDLMLEQAMKQGKEGCPHVELPSLYSHLAKLAGGRKKKIALGLPWA